VLLAIRTNVQRTTHSDADATFAFHVHLRGFSAEATVVLHGGRISALWQRSALRRQQRCGRMLSVADRSADRPPHPSHGQLALSGRRFVVLGLAVLALGTTEELRRSALQ
jgi:hypothetical protein